MQVILREDVPDLGKTGDLVTIKDGFGRNFLIPRGLAVMASLRNVKRMDHEKRLIEQQNAKRHRDALSIKEKIESLSLTITKHTAEEDKLFGSVTNREIAEALKEEGLDVDRKTILLEQPIKALGVYTVTVRLTGDLTANLKVWVVAK